MKKSVLIVMLFVFHICFVASVSADNGLNNFEKINYYDENTFLDVSKDEWYSNGIQYAYEKGLVSGIGDNMFNPTGNITLAETVALASRLNNIYFGRGVAFEQSDIWFVPYVDYAINNGIIGAYDYYDYNALATRAEFASIIAHAIPTNEYNEINTINKGDIPDIALSYNYADDVYMLYRAGVISGTDEYGSFSPSSNIQRNAVAVIVSRVIDVSQRINNNIPLFRKDMCLTDLGKFSGFGHVMFVKYHGNDCGYAYVQGDKIYFSNTPGEGPWDFCYSLSDMEPFDMQGDFISQIFFDLKTAESNNSFLKELIYFKQESDDAKTFRMIENDDDQYISLGETLNYVEIEYKGKIFKGITAQDYLNAGLCDGQTGIWKGVRFYCNHIGSAWVYVNYNLNDIAAYFDQPRRFYIDSVGSGENIEPAIKIVD